MKLYVWHMEIAPRAIIFIASLPLDGYLVCMVTAAWCQPDTCFPHITLHSFPHPFSMLLLMSFTKPKSDEVGPDSNTSMIPCCSKDRAKFLLHFLASSHTIPPSLSVFWLYSASVCSSVKWG